jgi:aspartyl-tRNA synthetase
MHRYRTHHCSAALTQAIGQQVRLSGWVHRKRDHGNLLFIDLRDHYGMAQCVLTPQSSAFALASDLPLESVVSIEGLVTARTPENVNPNSATGTVELEVKTIEVLSKADPLPFSVATAQAIPEEMRLRSRFLDLRREKLHKNIVLRSQIIAGLRRRMIEAGFLEYQTPILTSSSPEGARDFLVPSRLHHGKFYALPQAPQQFKQLLMVAGFDRYFQIAPCFRDEDARADRSPGEFYQLDMEMSFVEQDDVFAAIEPVLYGVYKEFSDYAATPPPFPRIAWDDAMARYGSDKPDLRNPLQWSDVSAVFAGGPFAVFAKAIEQGAVVRALPAPGQAAAARSFFDKVVDEAKKLGAGGLAYVQWEETPRGTLAKFITPEMRARLEQLTGSKAGDALFFLCDQPARLPKVANGLRTHLGQQLNLIEERVFKFCWIVDFPFYELDEETKQVAFSHNPFSMPQGGLEALNTKDPLSIRAYQYDIVCNGIELSSGAVRNHRPDVMLRAFEIAGYPADEVERRFGGMLNAFRYGAPPHAGLAPGVDRMVMQIAEEPNLREVIAFPLTQTAQDLMMNAPSTVSDKQLKELGLRIAPPPEPPGGAKSG